MYDNIHAAADTDFERTRRELEEMVRIPSVSAPDFDPSEVRRSADFVAKLMTDSGLENVHLLELEGAHPAVFAEKKGPEGAPTVLLYAHHDVQPPGPDSIWSTPPFEPIEREGRLFGRGTSDDKCGIAIHLSTLRVLGDDLPVNVKVFIEGEEEIGSEHLIDFLDAYAELLASDVIVIADASNWRVGTPALSTSLRGLVDCTVSVRTLTYGVHSGSFGGIYPRGDHVSRPHARRPPQRGRIRSRGGDWFRPTRTPSISPSTRQTLRCSPSTVSNRSVSGSLTSRTWAQPAISVLAIDAVPESHRRSISWYPEASAKVSMRIPPGQDALEAMDALVAHIEASVPWGAEVTVTPGSTGEAFRLDTTGAAYDAYRTGMREGYGQEPIETGVGGSIPFVAAFSERYPDASILLVGAADPTSRYHGPNESLELADLKRAIVAQAIALTELG